MSDHYHDPADLRLLKEMGKLAPTEFSARLSLDKMVGREDGAIPRKYRELIALAVACTTQRPYCIEVHIKAAKGAGAREEIVEASLLAAAFARWRSRNPRSYGLEILRSGRRGWLIESAVPFRAAAQCDCTQAGITRRYSRA